MTPLYSYAALPLMRSAAFVFPGYNTIGRTIRRITRRMIKTSRIAAKTAAKRIGPIARAKRVTLPTSQFVFPQITLANRISKMQAITIAVVIMAASV